MGSGKPFISLLNVNVSLFLIVSNVLRRSGNTAAANSGATALDLQRHNGWTSEKTALVYMANTKERKRRICKQITGIENGTKEDSIDAFSKKPAETLPPQSRQPSQEQFNERSVINEECFTLDRQGENITVAQTASSGQSAGELLQLPSAGDVSSSSRSKNESGAVVYHINLAGASHLNLNFR